MTRIDWPVFCAFTCIACMFLMNVTAQENRIYLGIVLIGAWVALGMMLFGEMTRFIRRVGRRRG